MAIHPDTTVGPVALTVRDLDTAKRFYERAIGLSTLAAEGATAMLGVEGEPMVELVAAPDAPPAPRGSTGLYHLAILVPDRAELGRALLRLAETRTPLAGASDHLVSEALYAADPEGNGIEIYRDRPRAEWRRDGDEIAMATLPLDLRDVASVAGEATETMPAGTRIGHVHLHVADLAAAERFYGDLLGFDVTARGYPGALFMSAGGYHHHIGVNTWAGEGAPAPRPGAGGLRAFTVTVPGPDEIAPIVERLDAAGVAVECRDGSATVGDPSGNVVVLSAV